MIFDNAAVTEKVLHWQTCKDPDVLTDILEDSRSLVEALVSQYDPYYRDDLIQESMLKIVTALPAFNAKLGVLHTYFTTVIKNACISWLQKYDRGDIDIDDLEMVGAATHVVINSDLLQELTTRNRERFPSLPTETIDELTYAIYNHLRNSKGTRVLLRKLVEHTQVPKSIAQVVYTSTLVWLRAKFVTYSKLDEQLDEFSLQQELMDVLGCKPAKHMMAIFTGITLHIP